MSLSMAPLLMHSPDVPAIVRAELQAAYAAAPERRDEHLVNAARLLSWMVPLDCADALELVGLRSSSSSAQQGRPRENLPRMRAEDHGLSR